MVGLTCAELKLHDFCYIVIYTPVPPYYLEEAEFLEGIVRRVNHRSTEMPAGHPIWKFSQTQPKTVQSICAEVTYDPKAAQFS